MKHSAILKITLSLLLVALTLIPILVACNRPDSPSGETTTPESTEPFDTSGGGTEILPPAITGQLLNDTKEFELKSGDSILKLGVQNNSLFITSAMTKEKEENRITAPKAVGLPAQYKSRGSYKAIPWTYAGYFNYRPEDADYTKYGYIFRFTCESIQLTYDLYVTAHFEFNGPFELAGYITSESTSPIEILPGDYFHVSMQGSTVPMVWRFAKESGVAEGWTIYDGTHFDGTGIYKTAMKKGQVVNAVTTTNQGWNRGGDIPMIYIDYGSEFGFYYGVEWSNCHIEAKSEKGSGDVTVSAGLGERKLMTTMAPKSTFYMPTVYMGVYEGDVDLGSNIFKRWFLYNKAPDIILEDENEPLTQTGFAQDFNIVAQYGIQSLKTDYGWWSSEVAPGQTLWQVKEGLLELDMESGMGVIIKNAGLGSMKEFAALLKEKGLTWTVYILLKDCELDREGVPTSVGQYGHPEWFSSRKITVGRSADLGNVDCVKFFQQYMLNFFKETGVTTWRSDFEPICYTSDKANRHAANGSDVQYWCTVGFLELVDYLYDNLDYFRYESCSSGGSMKDLLTATRAVVINCDDSADYHSLKMSFYDSSYCFHPTQLQLPVSAMTYMANSDRYAGVGDYLYGLRSQLVGAAMMAGAGRNTDLLYWEKYLTVYNARIKPLIRYGDLYHIFDRPDGIHWDGFAYIDADAESSTKGLVMLWKPSQEDGDTKTIKLRGLDADKTYRVDFHDRNEQSVTMTGRQLMNEGFTITMEGKCGSEWVWIVEKTA